MSIEWNTDEYGNPEDYGVDPEIETYRGFAVGDRVSVVVEMADNGTGGVSAYEGDEGDVIGFTKPSKGGGPFNLPAMPTRVMIAFDGMDPEHVDADDIELL